MIAHVSPAVQAYNETLQVIQLAARIHRMKRRRTNKVYIVQLTFSSITAKCILIPHLLPSDFY